MSARYRTVAEIAKLTRWSNGERTRGRMLYGAPNAGNGLPGGHILWLKHKEGRLSRSGVAIPLCFAYWGIRFKV